MPLPLTARPVAPGPAMARSLSIRISPLVSVITGHTNDDANSIVSPAAASTTAWRSDPAPESAQFSTVTDAASAEPATTTAMLATNTALATDTEHRCVHLMRRPLQREQRPGTTSQPNSEPSGLSMWIGHVTCVSPARHPSRARVTRSSQCSSNRRPHESNRPQHTEHAHRHRCLLDPFKVRVGAAPGGAPISTHVLRCMHAWPPMPI